MEYELEIKKHPFKGAFVASRCSVKSDKKQYTFFIVSKEESKNIIVIA